MKSRLKVYIAGPYSNPDPVVNIRIAVEWWHKLWATGFAPFCPHLSLFLHIHQPLPYEEWLDADKHWIEVCDGLLRFPGQSSGADLEVKLAESLGIPVFYNIEDLIAWKEAT